MKQRPWEKTGKVEAIGEVEGVTFVIKQAKYQGGHGYTWFTYKGDEFIERAQEAWSTIEEAVSSVMKVLVPDAIPVEYVEPTAEDFEALNALLYVGGLQSDITTFQEALIMYTGFQEGLPIMLAGREKMSHDLDQITNDLKAVRGAMSDRVQNLIKMKEVVMVQYDILETITVRNLETLFSFIDQFLKK